MTLDEAEAWVLIIGAVTVNMVLLIRVFAETRSIKRDVNGRMDQFLSEAREASYAKGRLEAPRRRRRPPEPAETTED